MSGWLILNNYCKEKVLYISEQQQTVMDKYNMWLQLLKQLNEGLFIYSSTFRSTFVRTQRRPC